MRAQALASILMIAGAGAALAQDASDDWDIVRQPEQNMVFTYLETSTGLTFAFRCMNGAYGAVLAGLPEAPADASVRTLEIKVRDGAAHDTRWSVLTDRTAAIADYPAGLARDLRQGGVVSILVRNATGPGRNVRYNVELPASANNINETLTECERPLDDPRDALLPEITESGLPEGMTWDRAPRPSFPRTNIAGGFAVVTCLAQADGRLQQCQVESEFPLEAGFGRSALRAANDARVVSPNETPGAYTPRIVGFRVNYTRGRPATAQPAPPVPSTERPNELGPAPRPRS